MSAPVVRFVVMRGDKCLRLYEGGANSAALLAVGWVAPDTWHAVLERREDAEAIAAQLNADHPRLGARVEERRT